jgi:hypothetical protein
MNKKNLPIPQLLYIFSFFLYLFSSSMTLIQHGVELSLWLMTFAVLLTGVTTIFPWLGITWLKLEPKGSHIGYGIAITFQFLTWGSFSYAMFLRLNRDLENFYTWITITTLLWAAWLIIFLLSRYAIQANQPSDKLNQSLENKEVL